MRKRADDVEATRQHIVAATMDLHTSIGPAATTIAAIAAKAGVTRLTVYRHFPDAETLFTACTQLWMSKQELPDPDAWERIDDPVKRVRSGLADLYRFYAAGERALTLTYRDWESLPDAPRIALAALDARHRKALAAGFHPQRAAARRRLHAAVGHAVAFPTWRSLCVDQGLSVGEAIKLIIPMITFAAAEQEHHDD